MNTDWQDIALPLVAKFEGCEKRAADNRIHPYLDKLANPPKWTRGYGRTYGISETSPAITKDEAKLELLDGLTRYAAKCATLAAPLASKSACLAAVTSWSWNCGLAAFRISRLRRSILAGRWSEAARQIRTPRTAGGRFISGLARRRDIEYSIFLINI